MQSIICDPYVTLQDKERLAKMAAGEDADKDEEGGNGAAKPSGKKSKGPQVC